LVRSEKRVEIETLEKISWATRNVEGKERNGAEMGKSVLMMLDGEGALCSGIP
jgi:hypothetical protein